MGLSSRGETHRTSPPPRRQNVSAELRPARALPIHGARALSGPLAMLPARAAAAAALLAAALLLCAGAAAAAPDHILRRDDLIGWGEVPAAGGSNPDELRRGRAPGADAGAGAAGTDPDAQRALPDPAAAAAAAAAARPRGQEILSWSPRVILFRGLLTDAECDHLVARATPRLARSGVVDEEADGEGVSDIRTSDGALSCSTILNY